MRRKAISEGMQRQMFNNTTRYHGDTLLKEIPL